MKGNEVHVESSRMQYLLHFNCTLSQPQLCHQEKEKMERLYALLWFVLSSWFHIGRSTLCECPHTDRGHWSQGTRVTALSSLNTHPLGKMQQPGFTPCEGGACGLVKQLPPPQGNECYEEMEDTKHILPAVWDADSPAWSYPVVF